MAGCFNQRFSARMAKWVGKTRQELVSHWGDPNRVEPDGRGGSIYIYGGMATYNNPATQTSTTTFRGNTATTQTVYNPGGSNTFEWYRKFWIDQNGTVYAWSWLN